MGSKRNQTNRVVAFTAAIVIVATFGIGAAALAQSSSVFDPSAYASAYEQNQNDNQKGYRANSLDTDAAANRQDDNTAQENENQPAEDAFSDLPLDDLSGNTVGNLTDDASTADATVSGDLGNEAGGSNEPGGSDTPGVIVPVNPTPTPGDEPSIPYPEEDFIDPTPSKDTDSDNPIIGSVFYPIIDDDTAAGADLSKIVVNIMQSELGEYKLYVGQHIDAWKVFCTLSTAFAYTDENGVLNAYKWQCNSAEEFETYPYFKIIPGSYPEVVPDVESFEVRVAYRISTSDDWIETTAIVKPVRSITYIMKAARTGENTANNTDAILDTVYATKENNSEEGSENNINLHRFTNKWLLTGGYMREDGTQTHLLLNWKEDGEAVPWFYTATTGRHIIYAEDVKPIDDAYTVTCEFESLSPDVLPEGFNTIANTYCHLQTLRAVDGESGAYGIDENGNSRLIVPDGIEAIEPTWDANILSDVIEIPSTVLYIDEYSYGFCASQAYVASENSPCFSSNEAGILTNKDGTAWKLIPTGITEITIPETVTQLNISLANNFISITFEGKDIWSLPYIDMTSIYGCNFIVEDEVMHDFLLMNYSYFSDAYMNTISQANEPEIQYHYLDGMIVSGANIVSVIDPSLTLVKLNSGATLKEGCFTDSAVSTIILNSADDFDFDENSMIGSYVSLVICETKDQKDYLDVNRDSIGMPDTTDIVLGSKSDEGYRYYTENGQTVIYGADGDVVLFTGVMSVNGETVYADTIAPGTLSGSTSLEWVLLDEHVKNIGAKAFSNCIGLQGAVIYSADYIQIGADAFSNCSSMRFWASQAEYASFESWFFINASCQCYIPAVFSGYEGYGSFLYFNVETGITSYEAIPTGDSYLLYGCEGDTPWLLLVAGGNLPEVVTMPVTTQEIFDHSFENILTPFTIEWEKYPNLAWIDPLAFNYSGLEGDVVLGTSDTQYAGLGEEAFANSNITSFTCESQSFTINTYVFSGCTMLKSVKIGAGWNGTEADSLYAGVFTGCDSLESIEFSGAMPRPLVLIDRFIPFTFNLSLSVDEEAQGLKLIVDPSYQEAYIEAWVYLFTGNADYDYLKQQVEQTLTVDLGHRPSTEEIQNEITARLLKAENNLRTMMGMSLVDAPTIDYPDSVTR